MSVNAKVAPSWPGCNGSFSNEASTVTSLVMLAIGARSSEEAIVPMPAIETAALPAVGQVTAAAGAGAGANDTADATGSTAFSGHTAVVTP